MTRTSTPTTPQRDDLIVAELHRMAGDRRKTLRGPVGHESVRGALWVL